MSGEARPPLLKGSLFGRLLASRLFVGAFAHLAPLAFEAVEQFSGHGPGGGFGHRNTPCFAVNPFVATNEPGSKRLETEMVPGRWGFYLDHRLSDVEKADCGASAPARI